MPPFLFPKRGRKAASKRARKGKKRAEGGGRSFKARKRPRISKAEYRRRAAKAAKTRAKNKRAKAKRAAARKPGKGTGSKTRLPPVALWSSPNRSKSLPLLAGKPSAGETFEVVAILAMDQSVSTTSKGGEEGAKWISDRFFLGKMTIAEALSMDAETILGRYRAAWGSKRRGKATRVLALLRPKHGNSPSA